MALGQNNEAVMLGNVVMELKRVGNLLETLVAVERDTQSKVADTFFLLEKKLDTLISRTGS